MVDKTESLEKRLDELERRIYGASNKDAAYPKVIDTLASVNARITEAVTGRTKIQPLLKRLGELEMLLDPSYTDRESLSVAAKTEIIIAEEDLIRKNAENLEKVRDMAEVLGSEHIKAVPTHEARLQQISTAHLKQQDEVSLLGDDVKKTLQQYNHIVTLMSKQFAQWDELVTAAEIKAGKQPETD